MTHKKKVFLGYPVPKNIKNVTMAICKRFNISSMKAPMCIANTIAVISELGNGKGKFEEGHICHVERIIDELQNTCNICKSEQDRLELRNILFGIY